jgi:hypothetical protein
MLPTEENIRHLRPVLVQGILGVLVLGIVDVFILRIVHTAGRGTHRGCPYNNTPTTDPMIKLSDIVGRWKSLTKK